MICPTIPKVEYCVTTSVSGYVTDAHSGKVLCALTPHVQSRFVAISLSVQIPDEGVEITGPILATSVTKQAEEPIDWEAGSPIEMLDGCAYRLHDDTNTASIQPRGNNDLIHTTLLYSPAEARTTPLIAVPDGVTLHWAGDAEPAWEAGKDYVIQLLQTSPTHIEARLFNAPTGVNVGEGDYLIWEPHVDGQPWKLKAARLTRQTNGAYQFYSTKQNPYDETLLSERLATETFGEQIDGSYQFATRDVDKSSLTLASATFDKQANGSYQFAGGYIIPYRAHTALPKATFANTKPADYMFRSNRDLHAPHATFAEATSAQGFLGDGIYVYLPVATFAKATSLYTAFCVRRDIGTAPLSLPSVTAESATNVQYFLSIPGTGLTHLYVPHLNLRSATNAFAALYTDVAIDIEVLKTVTYGPRLDAETGLPVTTVTIGEDGEPIVLAEEVVYASGEHKPDDGIRPTGWGIKDFRELNEDGTFVQPFTRPSTAHQIGIKTPHGTADLPASLGGTSASGDVYAQVLRDLYDRGWTLNIK